MDNREAIIHRNQQMANAYHQEPVQHRLRRTLIQAVSNFRFAPLNARENRILFIKPDHIGDVLLATPAIQAVKRAQPYAEIHVLAEASSAQILANFDDIDQILTTTFPGFSRNSDITNPITPYKHLVRVSRQLRHVGYSTAIVLRPDHWWGAMLAHVAGIRHRIGYNLPDVAPFLTHTIDLQHEHVVKQSMRLVRHLTGNTNYDDVTLNFPVDAIDADDIELLLRQYSISEKDKIVCIHPCASTWVKQWENTHWAQVADTLIEQMRVKIIFTGTDSERNIIDNIQNRMRHKSWSTAGELTLNQLGALYAQASVVLGVDSAPLHLAAATHTPTVTLFGPADPIEFAPWGDANQHIILSSPIACRPCRVLDWGDDDPQFHPCMRDIKVGEVLNATRQLLQIDI